MQKSIFPGLFENFTVFFTYFKFVVLEALKFLSVKKMPFLKIISNFDYTCLLMNLQIFLDFFIYLKKTNCISLKTYSFSTAKMTLALLCEEGSYLGSTTKPHFH